MKAIEIRTKTSDQEELKLEYNLQEKLRAVRVLILLEDSEEKDEEKFWVNAVAGNPAFDFLKDDTEDIYSLSDGKPFNDRND